MTKVFCVEVLSELATAFGGVHCLVRVFIINSLSSLSRYYQVTTYVYIYAQMSNHKLCGDPKNIM